MSWAEGFIAVDWGTTNRRAYRLAGDGALSDEMEDGLGILSVESGGFPDSVRTIRERLGDLPMLMAGMIGSNRGWVEAPYVPCPAGLDELAARLVWAEPGRVAIVPGVSLDRGGEADVMRGEGSRSSAPLPRAWSAATPSSAIPAPTISGSGSSRVGLPASGPS